MAYISRTVTVHHVSGKRGCCGHREHSVNVALQIACWKQIFGFSYLSFTTLNEGTDFNWEPNNS